VIQNVVSYPLCTIFILQTIFLAPKISFNRNIMWQKYIFFYSCENISETSSSKSVKIGTSGTDFPKLSVE